MLIRAGCGSGCSTEEYLDDPACRAAVASAARLLESLGHHLEESAPAAMFEQEFFDRYSTLIAPNLESTLGAFEMALGRPIGEDEIEPRNAAFRQAGRALGAVAYLQSRSWLFVWARRMADRWTGHDLLLTPTLGARPPELGWFRSAGWEQEWSTIPGVTSRAFSFCPYTPQFNMTGQPAISLPLHWTPEGLPVGVQLVAKYGREDILIRVARQLEQAAPWSERHPPTRT